MNILLFFPSEVGSDGSIRVSRDDPRAKHIRGVLRLSRGSWVRAGIVDEGTGMAEVRNDPVAAGETSLELRFVEDDAVQPEVLPRIDLILGSVRPIQLKRLFRDLAAIGVSRISVAGTDLSEASYFHSSIWNSETLQQLLVQGASQGGHTCLPELTRFRSVGEAIVAYEKNGDYAAEEAVARIRLERGAQPAAAALPNINSRRIVLAIGPERGFTNRETALLEEAGFLALGIPAGILRTETAATAAVCIVRSWGAGA